MQEITSRLVEKYGSNRSIFFHNANCVWVLANVIQEAQSLDPTVIAQTWEKMKTIDTIFGTGIVCGTESYGIANHAVTHPQPVIFIDDAQVQWSDWFDVQVP